MSLVRMVTASGHPASPGAWGESTPGDNGMHACPILGWRKNTGRKVFCSWKMMTTWVPWPEFEAWIYTTCKWASSPQCVWLSVCVLLAQGAHMQRPCEDIRSSCLSLCTMLLWDESLTEARTGLVPNDPPHFHPLWILKRLCLTFSMSVGIPPQGAMLAQVFLLTELSSQLHNAMNILCVSLFASVIW